MASGLQSALMKTILSLLLFSLVVQAGKKPDVRYEPTPYQVVDEMLALGEVKATDVVYDLGSGDGRVVIKAAKLGAKAKGYEIDDFLVHQAQENIKKEKLEERASIVDEDIFAIDLSEATVVTLFLQPELNVRLIPQLEKLRPGSRIVSYMHDMKGMTPEKVATSKFNGKKIYLWRKR